MKIKKTPSGRYTTQVRAGGRVRRITADTKTECELRAITLKQEKSNTARSRASGDVLLGQAIDSFIKERSNVLSPSTVRGYQAIRNARFQSVMNKPIRSIRSWQRVINDESRLCAPKTLRNAWGLVRAVLREYGEDPGTVRLPMSMPQERPFLSPDQIKKFIKAIEGQPHELAFLLCLHGLRCSEMTALEKKDVTDAIHIHKARVKGADHRYITKETTKTRSSARAVPIFLPRVKELVAGCPDGVLVTSKPETLNKNLEKICLRNGFPSCTLHSLRHSFASLCYHLHISEQMCMDFGGWSDIATMRKIYTHIADEDRKKAASDLTAFFELHFELQK